MKQPQFFSLNSPRFFRNMSPKDLMEFCTILDEVPEEALDFGEIENQIITNSQLFSAAPSKKGPSLIGYCLVSPRGSLGYLEILGVHPEYRNRGVAGALIKEALKKFPRMFLYVGVRNLSAQRLYEKSGFSVSSFCPCFYSSWEYKDAEKCQELGEYADAYLMTNFEVRDFDWEKYAKPVQITSKEL